MKNFFARLLLSLVFIGLVFIPTYAQADTTGGSSGGSTFGLPTWVTTALLVLTGIYEVLVRLIPTFSNWSIGSLIGKILKVIGNILAAIVPNKKLTTSGQVTTHD